MFGNVPAWEAASGAAGGWAALPALGGEERADYCVVGLGGSGLSSVLELLAAGADVVGVDAGGVAGGAAGRNGGLMLAGLAAFHHDAAAELGPEHATRLYRLTEDAREAELERGFGAARRTGSLRIAADAAELADCRAQLERMRADGLPVEQYSGPEGEGLLFPADAVFNPLVRCRQMAELALARGARLYERSRAVDVAPGRVVLGGGAVVTCRQVIVAVDGGLDLVLPELRPLVRTARLQMLATAPAPELTLPVPVYYRYGFEYYQQLPDGAVAVGGFRDAAGDSEWTHDGEPSAFVQGRLDEFLRGRLGVRAPITHRWAASVGYSAGVLPVARELAPGLLAVGGYSGTGNLVGAVLGAAAARVALGGERGTWEAFGGNRA